jgi:hypothetical protein
VLSCGVEEPGVVMRRGGTQCCHVEKRCPVWSFGVEKAQCGHVQWRSPVWLWAAEESRAITWSGCNPADCSGVLSLFCGVVVS